MMPLVETKNIVIISVCERNSNKYLNHCSFTKSGPTLCDSLKCIIPGFPVFQYLPEFAQSLVHWVSDAIQPSHLLLFPSPPGLSLSKHQGLFQ